MKNIMVVDGAKNCVYDIFAATEEEFSRIFPEGQDIAFIDEVLAREKAGQREIFFSELWKRRVAKAQVQGIHGTLFYELEAGKVYYPTRRDEEAVDPGGSPLR